MTTTWLSSHMLHALGWALLHFLWQGAALSALAAVLMNVSRRASVRYMVGVIALVFMLLAPVVTFFVIGGSPEPQSPKRAAIADTQPKNSRSNADNNLGALSPAPPSLDVLPWLVQAWLVGVAFLGLRSAGGFLVVERHRRKSSVALSAQVVEICHTLQHRLGLNWKIRYCSCEWLQTPAVISWFRPIVLLPVTALTGLSEEQLRLVIAHELAHIRRFDPFVNVFQIAVETLLFYHPAVWWLNKRIRSEREHCCDDIAISVEGDPIEYARALTLMEEWRSAPSLAMAANGGPLKERIVRVLGLASAEARTRRTGLTGGLLCLSAALLAGSTLLRITDPKPTVHASTPPVQEAIDQPSPKPQAAAPLAPQKPSASQLKTEAAPPQPSSSYIDGLRAAGLGDVTVDQLIAMKIQGVTPEFVSAIREQGIRPNVDTLVAMKIQGVTPEYVRDMRALGISPTADQIVAMKIQGIDPAYVRGLNDAGIHPTVDQLIGMKIQGLTPEDARGFHALGLQPSDDELIAMRIQGVTPDYVRQIQSLGLKPTADNFIAMRIQGITPDYIKEMQSAGFKFSVDELIRAKIEDISRAFIDRAVKHGFQNLSLDKLIQLKEMGILGTPAEI